MKITEHPDGTKTLEGTAEELAAYYGKATKPNIRPSPVPCRRFYPWRVPPQTGQDWIPFWESPFKWKVTLDGTRSVDAQIQTLMGAS